MKHNIITISREFGCGAREIGQLLAARLNIPFHDKDLIDLTAERAGVSSDVIWDNDQELQSEKAEKLLKQFVYGSSTRFYSDPAINIQAEVVRELADKESALFFGRCSNYFLRDREDCLNIFLYAPLQEKITHISQEYGLSAQRAEKLITRVDKQRHNYYKYVTGTNRGDRSHNNLMLDVSMLGKQGTIDVILEACRVHFGVSFVEKREEK